MININKFHYKIIFLIITINLYNATEDNNLQQFKNNMLAVIYKNQNKEKKELIKSTVIEAHLSNKYIIFFENQIKKKHFIISKSPELLKLFHEDKANTEEEKNKVKVLRELFHTHFFAEEINNLIPQEEPEPIDINKLPRIHQNFQIATDCITVIIKFLIFMKCINTYKSQKSKIISLFISAYSLALLPSFLLNNPHEYWTIIFSSQQKLYILNSILNTFFWGFFIAKKPHIAFYTTGLLLFFSAINFLLPTKLV